MKDNNHDKSRIAAFWETHDFYMRGGCGFDSAYKKAMRDHDGITPVVGSSNKLPPIKKPELHFQRDIY